MSHPADRKNAKEEFVTGLSGTTTLWENQEVLVILMSSYLLWKCLATRFDLPARTSFFLAAVIEYVVLIVPLLCSITFTQWSPAILAGQVGISAVIAMTGARATRRIQTMERPKHRPFSLAFRSYLQIMTVACILAVDFKVFPRKFAKTETYGTSLMDLGVGAFIFSNGFVAGPRLMLKTTETRPIIKSLKISIPVLIMGLIRIAVTKGVNYQEHVTEYGVHWNFFFTLGLIPLFTAVLQSIFPKTSFAVLSVVFMALYEAALQFGGADYILTAEREGSLFALNREGICSFYGYWAIFLFAAHIGADILAKTPSSKGSTLTSGKAAIGGAKSGGRGSAAGAVGKPASDIVRSLFIYLLVTASVFAVAYEGFGAQISRRMANLTYSTWVVSSSLVFLLGCLLIDLAVTGMRSESPRVPILFESVNRNQLATFLLANLMTGVVNLSMDTINANLVMSFTILAGHMAVIQGVAVMWHRMGITIKL
ncbi:Glucosaminyl phosphatidylinositol (GlcN-PI) nositol acylation protein [Irineochytrium annulatum]|nr:Glucosaminyl phosphatidylinositol (GlcN-PI) nositol acylation protein [Irineochytrium annulatum]